MRQLRRAQEHLAYCEVQDKYRKSKDIIAKSAINMDRLSSLTAFVNVADLGGFAAAARAMRVSPTATTRAVAALEERLGVVLFARTTRSVRLTDEGAQFLVRVRQVLADLQTAEHLIMGAQSEPQGTLVVTAPMLFGRMHVVPVIAGLLGRHPRLAVRLLLLDRPVQLVEEGVDVAVRIGDLADSALRAVRLGEVRRILVASPAYLDRHGTPTAIGDLRGHALVAFSGITPNDEWRFGPQGETAVQVAPRLLVNNADAAIAAVVHGLGIGRFLSYQVANELAAGSLRSVLDEVAPAPDPINVIFSSSRSASPMIRSFVDAAKHSLRGEAF